MDAMGRKVGGGGKGGEVGGGEEEGWMQWEEK